MPPLQHHLAGVRRGRQARDLDTLLRRLQPPGSGPPMTRFSASSANYATFEDVEILRRQIVALQDKIAEQQASLESGRRLFDAIERSLTSTFHLLVMLWVGVIAALIIGVIALAQR